MSQYQGIKQKDTGGVQIDGTIEPVEITGGVQIGDTIVELEGMQRFNSVSKKMEYWDGVAWIEMAAGGGGAVFAFDPANTPGPQGPAAVNATPVAYYGFTAQAPLNPVIVETP